MSALRFPVLVFDWDGTLANSTGPIAICMQEACQDLGLRVPTLAEAMHVIGLGLDDALGQLVPELPVSDYDRLVDAYRRRFLARGTQHALYDGLRDLLEELAERGHRLAVATGKSALGLQRSLESTGLLGRFEAVRTADITAPKPDPSMLLELLDELAVAKEQMLMIGDTVFDLEMAERAGVAALAVTYGAHPVDELRQRSALSYIPSPTELRDWLLTNA